jgi:hypothetical protein
MADWTRAERTRVTVEYEVPAKEPWGACWNQVQQALDVAREEYFHNYEHGPADDAISVHVTDDAIKVIFEKKNGADVPQPPVT